jgi:glycosyltransferase involved in cell wall biosynthesis
MLAYTFYESDNRVMRYAEALARHAHQVDVVALAGQGRPTCERINNVQVYRIQERILDEKNSLSYAKKLLEFLLRSAWFFAKYSTKVTYDLVHVHNIPDFLVFAALIPRLRGAKIILDIHDIVPELYESKFGSAKSSWRIKLLKYIERLSTNFSDFVVIANDIWCERLRERSVSGNKIMTILNYPDLNIFHRHPPRQCDGKFVVIYPGTLSWHQGVDIVVKAFDLLRHQLPQAQFHIYGDGHEKSKLMQMVADLGLQDRVLFKNSLTLREIAHVMAQANLGVEPKRKSSFANEALSTKIFELMATGIPVVASDTKAHQFYFDSDTLCFFRSEDPQSLADSIVRVYSDAALRDNLRRNAFDYIARNNWRVKEIEYLCLVERLTGKKTFIKAKYQKR